MKPFGKENGGEKFDFTKMFRKSAPVETIKDDYDEAERTLSDADAHRDVSYELPSNIKQIWIAYLTQMKRFTKEKTVWGLLVLLALIPIIYIVLINNLMEVENSHVTNIYISTCLMAMPIISMFICTTVCGSMLPREYNERTIYFSLPLPMSRFAFYIGKFFAGLTLCWGVITAAYGISILMALMGGTDATYSGPLFKSLLVMMASTFFFCAFTYMMSAHSKRGSSMRAILFLAIALPALIILVKFLPNVEALSSFKGIVVQDDPKNNVYPMPIYAENHDEVFVGRIRIDESVESGVNLWVVADNIRKGAATNAVQIVELLIKEQLEA